MKKENTLKTKTSDVVSTVFKVIIFIVLCIYAATIIYLLFWGLLTSLKSDNDFTAPNNNMFGLPDLDRSEEEVFGLHNYVLVFTKKIIGGRSDKGFNLFQCHANWLPFKTN